MQRDAVCCSVLQCVAVCCSTCKNVPLHQMQCVAVCCSVLQCLAVPAITCHSIKCSVLQCVAVCCSVLQCVAVPAITCPSIKCSAFSHEAKSAKRINAMPLDSSVAWSLGIWQSNIAPVMCVGMYVFVSESVCMFVRKRECVRECVCSKCINAVPFDSSVAWSLGIWHSNIAPVMCVGMYVCVGESVCMCVWDFFCERVCMCKVNKRSAF